MNATDVIRDVIESGRGAPDILATLAAEGFAVVKLPEPDYDDDGQAWFGDGEIRVDLDAGREHHALHIGGRPVHPQVIHVRAAALLAAAAKAEEAGR